MTLRPLAALLLSCGTIAVPLLLHGCGGSDDNGATAGGSTTPPATTTPTPQPTPAVAANLKDCCTAGDKDFPKVGGNLGNQNYSALRADHTEQRRPAGRRLAQPRRRRRDRRHQPEHPGRRSTA